MAKLTIMEEKRNISEAISIDKFERSITRISREIEQQEDRKRSPVRKIRTRSVEEELRDITIIDSFLPFYERR